MSDAYELCRACGCRPCLPWCRRVLRGDAKPMPYNPDDPTIRAQIAQAKAGGWEWIEHKQTGGD